MVFLKAGTTVAWLAEIMVVMKVALTVASKVGMKVAR
jgi:hypothetical protein